MRVYKCDRCGKYVSGWDMYDIKMAWRVKQICDDCYSSLRKWFKDQDAEYPCDSISDPKAKEESE